MATLVSIATGNFTSSSTWGVVDSTSYLDSEANATAIGTSSLDSATFTPGAITIDRIALKLSNRATSPSGTFTVTLRNSTDSTNVVSVTVNVSDLPFLGWVVFNIGSQLLVAGKAYLIRVVCSASGSQVTLNRNSTANNWSRLLVTTTTGAPASGDQLVIAGELTGAGTGNSFTVTLDNTATTSFGPTVSGGPPQGICVVRNGIFTCGTSSSTDYYFKWKGVFLVSGGGTVNMGTSGSRVPSTSTLTLFQDTVAHGDTGIEVREGTWNQWGQTKTVVTLLTADNAASDTNLSVADTTGWEAGDNIIIAPSKSVGATHLESRTIDTVPSGTSVDITAGMTNVHYGTSPFQCEVINITSRVKIRANSTSLRGYIYVAARGSMTLRYTEIFYLGGAAIANKRGIELVTDASLGGAFDMQYCAYYSSGSTGAIMNGNATYTGITISYNAIFDCFSLHVYFASVGSFAYTMVGNVILRGTNSGNGITVSTIVNANCTFRLNRIAGGSGNLTHGLIFSVASGVSVVLAENSFDGNVIHTCGAIGFQLGATSDLTSNVNAPMYYNSILKDWVIYNTCLAASSGGFVIQSCVLSNFIFQNSYFVGNSPNVTAAPSYYAWVNKLIFIDCIFGNTSDNTGSSYGYLAGAYNNNVEFINCQMGVTSGIIGAHNNADLGFQDPLCNSLIILDNTKLNSSVPILGLQNGSGADELSVVHAQRYGQVDGDHRSFYRMGTISLDSAIYNTAAPSERLAPTSASIVLKSSPMFVPVADTDTVTISVSVRKSVSSDPSGADYNGNQPQLILRRNYAAGITSDTVIDTMTAAIGNWETLTGVTSAVTDDATLEFYVTCDGTAGWINVDDWTVS